MATSYRTPKPARPLSIGMQISYLRRLDPMVNLRAANRGVARVPWTFPPLAREISDQRFCDSGLCFASNGILEALPLLCPLLRGVMSFYRRWTVACAAGELVGIGVAAGAALTINALIGEPQSLTDRLLTLATFAAVGAVEGFALAVFQWRVLCTRLPRLRAGEWIGVTVALAAMGWIVGMTPSLFIAHTATTQAEPGLGVVLFIASIAGAGAGLCFGAAQWFILRRHAEHSSRWVWIHVPAWALAMSAIFLGASLPDSESPVWFIALAGATGGTLGGLLLGAVTGLVARQLRPWVDEERWSLRGKVCVVTGANSGIGQQVALGLARLGASVVLLCRRTDEGERVRQRILATRVDAHVSVVACDVGDFGSIRQAADQVLNRWRRLDVLVHNAGATFPQRRITVDGIEATLAIDVVGPFLLTALLRERIEDCRGRVITLTGIYQRRGRIDTNDLHFVRRPYDWLAANNQAQHGRWLFMSELARRAPRLSTAAVHPGAVLTGAQAGLPRLVRAFIHTLARPVFVRPEVGAIPVLRLASQPDVEQMTGRFFNRCRAAPDAADVALAQRFWDACEAMTGEPSRAMSLRPIDQEEKMTATITTPTRDESIAPGSDPVVARFVALQSQLLESYGVRATSRFVQLRAPAIRAHLLEGGKGKPVVIFHGGDGEAVDWAPLMGPLQNHVHIYAVDRPGCGLSDPFDYRAVNLRRHAAEFVASLLDALGLASATLVGGSMGGFFALVGALDLPNRVDKVVLVGYPVGLTNQIPVPLRIICGVPGMAKLFMRGRPTIDAQKKQYQRMFHVDPATVPDLYFRTRLAGIELPSAQGTWSTLLPRVGRLRGLRPEVYLGEELHRIKAPVLVLWGDDDFAPAEVGRAATAGIPNGRFVYLPGVGHFPFLEVPGKTSELIADFVSESRDTSPLAIRAG